MVKKLALALALGLIVGKAAGVTNEITLPASVPDPLEPFNRAMWAANRVLVQHVIQPSGRVYRFVARPPVRRGLANIERNLFWPQRTFNNLLQGRWMGAGWETERFLCNSTIGIGGFFDVASKWKIPKSDADFGQTFGEWGWNPDFYLMLPFLGPSNDRDAVGLAAQAASEPLTYFTPWAYIPYFLDYNDAADRAESYSCFMQSEMDPYALTQYAWTFARKNEVANFQVKGEIDRPSLETLQYVFFTYDDPEFPARAHTGSALIGATHRRLKYSYWLQPGRAPVMYIVPGLGSHRLADSSIALAELAYKNGFSAVSISSPFNSEFMESASTAIAPGYLPVDGEDLRRALTAVDRAIQYSHPGRLGLRGLMGYSMGAFESLYLAATQSNHVDSVYFDRYVAINTPVRLVHSAQMLDEFYRAPLAWPETNRTADIQNTFLKVAALSQMTLTEPSPRLPFDSVESKFLIGLQFRFTLRDIIYDSQRRHDEGVLRHKIHELNRRELYQEIMGYSYMDYFHDFLTLAYKKRGIDLTDSKTLDQAGDLRTYAGGLKSSWQVRVVGTEDDFLLGRDDLAWLRATFPPDKMTLFPAGGHLGNLANPAVQRAVLRAMEEMRPVPQSKKILAKPDKTEQPPPALP